MKRLTILGLAALAASTGTSFGQDLGMFGAGDSGAPGLFGLANTATQGRHDRGRRPHGPRGPGFEGFVLGGEEGYGLISVHIKPPRPPGQGDTETQYLAASEYSGDTTGKGRFQGFVRVNGRAYGVVNLQQEQVASATDDISSSQDFAAVGASSTPQRREIARISADLVPLKRGRPPGAEVQPTDGTGSWPGSWLDDSSGEQDGGETPTGRIQGSIVAFGPPPPPPAQAYTGNEQGYGYGQGYEQGLAGNDQMQERRGKRGPPPGGLVFEGQVVTEDTSGQVLARMSGRPHGPPRGGPGGAGGFGGQEMTPPPTGFPEEGDLY